MYPLLSNKYNIGMEQYPSEAPKFSIDDEVSTVTDMDISGCEIGSVVKIDVGFDGNPAFNSRVWHYTILLNSGKTVVRDGSDLVLVNKSPLGTSKYSLHQKVKIADMANRGQLTRIDGIVVGVKIHYDRQSKPYWEYIVEVAKDEYRAVKEFGVEAA